MMLESIERKQLKGINKATEQIHVAVQYLAAIGEFLGEQTDDGSHSNLGWLSIKEKFITNPFGKEDRYALEFSPELMQITMLDMKEKKWARLDLKGLSQEEGLAWITAQLKNHKIGGAKNYKLELPYNLPEYANFEKKKFKRSPKKAFLGFSTLRSWAEHFVNKYKQDFEFAEQTRTWPHHLDHSSYIPLAKLKSGEVTKSISFGLAIHDGMIDEPYFYISAWQKEKDLDLSKLDTLSSGYWLNEAFKGSVLPVLDLTDDLDFEAKVDLYFQESIDQLLKLIKYKPKA